MRFKKLEQIAQKKYASFKKLDQLGNQLDQLNKLYEIAEKFIKIKNEQDEINRKYDFWNYVEINSKAIFADFHEKLKRMPTRNHAYYADGKYKTMPPDESRIMQNGRS